MSEFREGIFHLGRHFGVNLPFDNPVTLKFAKLTGEHAHQRTSCRGRERLEAGPHYLDISNEIAVYRAAHQRAQRAYETGITILPGTGFDNVASTCLARHVCNQIESPIELEVAVMAYVAQSSNGTVQSMLEMLAQGGQVRKNGTIKPIALGSGARGIRFADQERPVLPMPTGDLEALALACAVPDITVYWDVPLPPVLARTLLPLLQKMRYADALRQRIGRWLGARRANSLLTARHSQLWACATSSTSQMAEALLEASEGYAFAATACGLAAPSVRREINTVADRSRGS